MSTKSIPYGAPELKHAMHRYWMFGFALSVIIHVAVLGLQELVKTTNHRGIIVTPFQNGGGKTTIDLVSPSEPGLPLPGGRVTESHVKRGIPVAVRGNDLDPEQTIPAQHLPGEGEGSGVGPVDGGRSEGIGGGALVVDGPPPIFLPLEKEPVIVRSVTPDYPELALRAGLEGRVVVRIWVDKEGKIRDVVVLQSTDGIFIDAAVEAARKYVFAPAYMNSGPVAVWVTVPFIFRIKR